MSDQALSFWQSYAPAPSDHPALAYTGLSADQCRVVPLGGDMPFPDDEDWLVAPLHGASGDIRSLVYFHPQQNNRPRFSDGYPQGALICGKPSKTAPLYLLTDPANAALYAAAGHAALATLTPDDWSRPSNDKKYTTGQNMAAVAKAWVRAGYKVEVPICCHLAKEFAAILQDIPSAKIIPLIGPPPMLDTSELTVPYSRAEVIKPTRIDLFSPLPDANDKGKPLSTSENLAEIVRRIGAMVRYNVISKKTEILLPNCGFSVDNHANAAMSVLIGWANRFGMPTGNLDVFLTQIADENPYNPVANWIGSRAWDGRSRKQAFFDTLTEQEVILLPDGRKLKDILVERWMLSAVAAAFEPNGISSHGVLVLQGDQYLGKTKWMKGLAPKELSIIKDGLTLNPSDKDSVMLCVRNWIVELGELDATFRKADIANLKSFITSDRDILRRPYDRFESEFARRTVFFASVNPRQFLHDATGNRRFWVIECKHINHDHNLDMQQVWAEIYELYKSGQEWFLTPDEMTALNSKNEDFMSATPVLEMVDIAYEWGIPAANRRTLMTATQVAKAAGLDRPTKSDVNDVAQHLRQHHKVTQRADPATKVKKFVMPPLVFVSEV